VSLIEISNIKKIYTKGKVQVKALDGVSLTFNEGEFSSLAGPSGSGKTTLLNLIGGIDSADSGSICLKGLDLTGMSSSELAELRLHDIGFVFQAYNLIPVLSAVENVEYVLRLRGMKKSEYRERAMDMLDDVGLADMADRRPAELSGGQQQRVAVARAIVGEPALVLADEPTANLDSKTGESLLELMGKMNSDKGVTFIFSTHDKMVMDFAKRLIILKDGHVESDNTK